VTTNTPNPNFIADEDGKFSVEVAFSGEDEKLLTLDHAIGDDAVLLTVYKGPQHIHLEMAPSDIPRLEEALDRCKKRVASEQENLRVASDGETDCT